jgi:hypothetical protein
MRTLVMGAVLLASGLCPTASPVGAAEPASRCTDASHQAWLSACFAATGSRNPPDWPLDLPASGYYPDSDLVRELASDCHARTAQSSGSLDGCDWQSHVDWLDRCVAELHAVVGSSRSALLKVVKEEGGISTYAQRDYQHRRCFPLKVEVTFSVDASATAESPDDVVNKVVPYIGWFVAD